MTKYLLNYLLYNFLGLDFVASDCVEISQH